MVRCFLSPSGAPKDLQHAEFPGHWLASLQLPANTLHYLSQGAGHGGGPLLNPARSRRCAVGDFDGRIAQLVEQLTLNQRVLGSSPSAPTIEINDLAYSL